MELSVPAAVVARYNSFSNVPPLYAFDAPVSDGGAQVFPPYAVLTDDGMETEFELELTVCERTTLRLHLYGETLQDVDRLVERIRFNYGPVNGGNGLDFGPLPALAIAYDTLEVRLVRAQRFMAVPTGKAAKRVFGAELTYRVTVYRTADTPIVAP